MFETQRLILRRYVPSDEQFFFRLYDEYPVLNNLVDGYRCAECVLEAKQRHHAIRRPARAHDRTDFCYIFSCPQIVRCTRNNNVQASDAQARTRGHD